MSSQEFWERVERYKQLGLDPLRWVAGCAVKVDLVGVVYPALERMRPQLEGMGIKINPREDADIFPFRGDGLEIHRQLYDLREIRVDHDVLRSIAPTRTLSLVQVHQKNAESPESFAGRLMPLYRSIAEAGVSFVIGKGHSIITPYPDDEFALFDFISEKEGRPSGYALANNDTIQIIDPTDDPGSQVQAFTALANALNDLICLGCHEGLEAFPVYDAPLEEMREAIRRNLLDFGKRYRVKVRDEEPLGRGRLLMGASVLGRSFREPPIHYSKLKEGMRIVVSRPFGDLAAINVYLSSLADPDYLTMLEEEGHGLDDVRRAKEEVISIMMEPNLKIAELIAERCPEYGEAFDESEHIAATGDLSGPGILIFKEIAQMAGVDIKLDEIPLAHPDLVRFAGKNYLMDNATAGTNGAIAMIASEGIAEDLLHALRREGYDARIIGRVLGKGEGRLLVGPEVKEMVASRTLLHELTIVEP